MAYSLPSLVMLYVAGDMHGMRRGSLRHKVEVQHRDDWLATAKRLVAQNYQLGIEVLQCRRLIKGYSNTHARGLSKFGKVMDGIALIEKRDDAAGWARRLREAAIKDAPSTQLDGVATQTNFDQQALLADLT